MAGVAAGGGAVAASTRISLQMMETLARRFGRRTKRLVVGRVRRASDLVAGRLTTMHDRLPLAGAVALTFDDGPHPVHTPQVLDVLRELGVHATFFMVGQRAADHPDLVRRIVAEGHSIGSHSATHPEPWTVGVRSLSADYRRGRSLVEEAAGTEVTLFRPPKGHWDLRGAIAARRSNLRPWRWTVDPEDWRPDTSSTEIIDRLAELTDGDVVLLHDSIEGPLAPSALDRSATVGALPGIVEHCRSRGLRLVTLS